MEALNEQLNKGINEIKNIALTSDEKARILNNILNSPAPVRSPYTYPSYFMILISKNRAFSYALISSFILVITLGGVVSASHGSLPGSALYPLKVNIVEPISSFLTFSEVSKAEYESHLATVRLEEAETLAAHGQLDSAKEQTLSTLLDNHTKALSHALDNIEEGSKADDNSTIINNFQSDMKIHAERLDSIKQHDENYHNIMKEGDDNGISKKARENGDKIKEHFKNLNPESNGKEGDN